MRFDPPLQTARLIKRYKRFLADLALPDGSTLTVHCPNTGSMLHCADPGSRAWYSTSDNPKRRYPHTLEVVEVKGNHLAGINTGRANALVKEALADGVVEELAGYTEMRAEVRYGERNSRIDLLLDGHPRHPEPCYVEIKNVTLGMGAGLGLFPDAVTERGARHLLELMTMKQQGCRAMLLFCVQHSGVAVVKPADAIDPVYGDTIRRAVDAGVEVLAYRADFELTGERVSAVTLARALPVDLRR